MDARRKTLFYLALLGYKKMLDQYAAQLCSNSEALLHLTRIVLMHTTPQRRHISIMKTGTQWEVMLNMDDNTFARHFRLNKPQFTSLLSQLQEKGISKEHSQGAAPVPVEKKVLMFLWYMANQNSFREMSDKFDVSQSSAHRIVMEVLKVICEMGHIFISWPNTCEKALSAAAFHRICGLRGVIGAIDGCHIRIQRPPVRGGDYMNRKSFYSILLQAIVDERGRFIDIFAGPPGRVHDARMLRASSFYDTWQEKMGEYRLLGDTAYISHGFPFIDTPKRDNGALTEADQQQNLQVSRGRVIVEQAFGRLKCKWRRLRDLQNTRLDAVVMIVMAACLLHNLCIGASPVCQDNPDGCPRQEDENE